jgi:hypothetical protein
MIGGILLLDYDRDSWPHIYFTIAPTVAMVIQKKSEPGAFYHNHRDGTLHRCDSQRLESQELISRWGRPHRTDDHSRYFPQYYSDRRRPQNLKSVWHRFGPVIEKEVNDLILAGSAPLIRPSHGGENARLGGAAATVFQRGARRASSPPSPTGDLPPISHPVITGVSPFWFCFEIISQPS